MSASERQKGFDTYAVVLWSAGSESFPPGTSTEFLALLHERSAPLIELQQHIPGLRVLIERYEFTTYLHVSAPTRLAEAAAAFLTQKSIAITRETTAGGETRFTLLGRPASF